MSERIVIKEICEVYDGPHATPKKTVDGPVYLGIDAITDDGKINAKEFAHLSEEDYIKWTKRVTPQYGDIVFSYEATLGRYALIPKDFYGCLGRRLAIIRNVSKDIDTLWLYYYFLSPEWKQFIQSKIIKGSTVNRISVEDFPTYTVPNISITVQRKIANILSKIDEKIALNNNIIENLQQQAILLYDYWFTQFDFPDANGKPYYSSGNKMTWNNQLKKNIPLSWKVKPLKAICEICLGGTPSTTVSKYWNGSISWLNSGEIAQFPVVSSEKKITQLGLENSPTKLMRKNTTVISITGNIRASILALDACANQSVVGILENEIFKSPFIYQNMLRLLKHYTSISTGNCQKHISKGAIEESLVCIPDSIVLKQYYSLSEPIYKQMHEIALENQHLTELRDWLLPMLMNGQVTIKD